MSIRKTIHKYKVTLTRKFLLPVNKFAGRVGKGRH